MQTVAAKGIALVYDIAAESERRALSLQLQELLLSARSAASDISDGAASQPSYTVTSDAAFKEICSIAAEVGRPELIPQLLALATSDKPWAGPVSGGLTVQAAVNRQAKVALQPAMGSLVPKLVRLLYDPHPKVRSAASHVWHSAVDDPKAAMADHLQPILRDLIAATSADQWRIRESAYSAISEVCSGRDPAQLVDQMVSIWQALLRGVDDVQDSVRDAATAAFAAVSKLTVRLCDTRGNVDQMDNRDSKAIINALLPYLLHEGVKHPIQQARSLSVTCLLDIVKVRREMIVRVCPGPSPLVTVRASLFLQVAGPLLRPFISDIVGVALEAVSETEPQELAYLQMHANAGTGMHGSEISPDKLECE